MTGCRGHDREASERADAGTMLLDRNNFGQALAAFEATIATEANRLGTIIVAARAAEKMGHAAKARQCYAKAVALAENADPSRTEIVPARAFLARM